MIYFVYLIAWLAPLSCLTDSICLRLTLIKCSLSIFDRLARAAQLPHRLNLPKPAHKRRRRVIARRILGDFFGRPERKSRAGGGEDSAGVEESSAENILGGRHLMKSVLIRYLPRDEISNHGICD